MEIGSIGASAYAAYTTAPLKAVNTANAAGSSQQDVEMQAQIQRLKQIDQKVHAHEQAHLSAAAGLSIGGATFQYVRGPDGRQYAVSGEVRIDTSAASTPEQTISKAQRIRAAALAPSDPSPQDQAVAAAAAQLESQARADLSRKKREDANEEPTPIEESLQSVQEPASERKNSRAIAAYQQSGPAPEPSISLFA